MNITWPDTSGILTLPATLPALNVKRNMTVNLDDASYPPSVIIDRIAAMNGFVDIFCWFEGPSGLPKSGAEFMKNQITSPLLQRKNDLKLNLYSLIYWDFKTLVPDMKMATRLGAAIKKVNCAAIDCFYAASFFKYCITDPTNNRIYRYLNESLPTKKWLIDPWRDRKPDDRTVSTFFANRDSLLDSMKGMDVQHAYSSLQYVEGYYLIQNVIRQKLQLQEKNIKICFVLANDEAKYYLDYPTELRKMLDLDFGDTLNDVEVEVNFLFFDYLEDKRARTYIDKESPKIKPSEVAKYIIMDKPPAL